MEIPPPVNHVLVDFENVQEIDFSVIGAQAVRFTLLIGARQTKLDTALVEKLLQHAGSVQLVRLMSSGRNALDFSLAYYLGRAVAADPTGHFSIISKDTGYDALVLHLRSKQIQVRRLVDFTSLSGSGLAKGVRLAAAASPVPVPTKIAAQPKPKKAPKVIAPALDEQAGHILEHLREHPKSRPSREKSLIKYILSNSGNKILATEVPGVIETLHQAGHIVVDEKGSVTYQL